MGTFRGKWTLEWVFNTSLFVRLALYYRKRGSASYIVREVREVRERESDKERERERERERDGSDVTLVALNLAMSFALLLAKNVHLSIGEEFCTFSCQTFAPLSWTPLLNGAEFTLSVAKYVAFFETVRILRRFCQMAWQGIEAPIQTIKFPAAPSFFSSKKWIKLIPKTIGNRKRDCAWGCAWGINTTWEKLQIEKHKSERRSSALTRLICAFWFADVLRWCLSP